MRAVNADRDHHEPDQHRRDCRAVKTEPEPEDEQRVEYGGGKRASQRHIHGASRIGDAAQYAGRAHAERKDGRRWKHDLQETRRQRQRLAARAHQSDEVVKERPDCYCQQGRGHAHEHQRCAAHARRFLAVAAAEAAGDKSAARDREADRHRDGEEQQRGGEADRRRQFLDAKQGNVKEIERVDDEDRDKSDRAGPGHDDDMTHRRAAGERRDLRIAWRTGHPG